MSESEAPGRKVFTTIETRFLAEGEEMDRAAEAESAVIVDDDASAPRGLTASLLGRWGALFAAGAGALLLGAAFLGGSGAAVPPTALAASAAPAAVAQAAPAPPVVVPAAEELAPAAAVSDQVVPAAPKVAKVAKPAKAKRPVPLRHAVRR